LVVIYINDKEYIVFLIDNLEINKVFKDENGEEEVGITDFIE